MLLPEQCKVCLYFNHPTIPTMSNKSQLIPGVVRIASAPGQQTTVAVDKQKSVSNSIIPGVVRAVSPDRVRKKPATGFIVQKVCTEPSPRLDKITQKAVEEIIKETALRKKRAEQNGPSEWRKCPLKKTNKRFLNRTVISMVNHNERVKKKTTHRSRLKLSELVRGKSVKLNKKKTHHKATKPQIDTSQSPVISLTDESD
uniref:Uncharacterized protein n=1 Tax=Anopheles atroparvus TaxID=41427 RepID=A0AAG5DL04_ANOAO